MLEGNDYHIFKTNKCFLNREHQITSSNAYYMFERGPRFVTDLCILFQFFFKDKQLETLTWQCRFCRNVVFKECSSFIVCLKEC